MVKCDAHGIPQCHHCSEYTDHLEHVNAVLLEALEAIIDYESDMSRGFPVTIREQAHSAIRAAKEDKS